jgi:hypothetical protein
VNQVAARPPALLNLGRYPAGGPGGGIDLFFDCSLTLTGCTVSNNLADAGQGTSGPSAVPARLAAGGGVEVSRFSTAATTGCTISNNTAVGGTGGQGANGGSGLGGGLAIITNSSAAVSTSDIEHNSAAGGMRGAGGTDGQGVGGGAHNPGTFLVDALTVIKHNRASTSNDDIFP